MACAPLSGCSQITNTSKDILKEHIGLRRSISNKDLCQQSRIRRSCSENHLCYYASRIRAAQTQPKLKNSRSMGIFNFNLSDSNIPDSIRSFFFEPETNKEFNIVESEELAKEDQMDIEEKKEKWIERLMEVRNRWKRKHQKDNFDSDNEGGEDCKGDGGENVCEVDYSDEEEEGKIDRESFTKLLSPVSWSDTKHFSRLAYLCNKAYVIPDIKAEELRNFYDLEFVTSSLEKKAEAAAIKAKLDQDSTRVPLLTTSTNTYRSMDYENKPVIRPSVAYEIAASAASYIHSRTKGLLSLGSEPPQEDEEINYNTQEGEECFSPRVYNSEVAAYVAASTMTAMVAADENEKLEAARNLQSLHSSPCEWFVCDDSSIYTRCFVIQGSDSLASWHANLFFEPAKFEGTNTLVHRGIYEAAKGIYEQFMPEILKHLNKYGERAKFQFTGHSLGGSLSLLVNLMLLTRKVIKPSALLPVVTFGAPFVFCGGEKILEELGLDENHVHSVLMHRDIVPRAFSCNYPTRVAQLLKRLNGTFRSHTCLNKNKVLYNPMGKVFILQPDEKSSPHHPFLHPGCALYALNNTNCGSTKNALRAFLNTPHPLETLSRLSAYGSEGTILRDHHSSNYLKAVNSIIKQQTRLVVRKVRERRHRLWPLLASQSPHACTQERNLKDQILLSSEIEVMTSA